MSHAFAEDILARVPELQSITIVPNYGELNGKFPPMLLGSRAGLEGAATAAEIVNTGQQIVRSLGVVHSMAASIIREIDQHMSNQSKALHAQMREADAAPDSGNTGTDPEAG